ncbi:hypothetical protein BDY19DRAFT_1059097 [Irpex rosettiformis]|uniref:Uncharacterized protein n=1 Tax=Irpex rosettiformis TaxID=378272 RepID=A0ACB8TW19_9APHY|nr:hypothetical protein BDY19DRAFT_1059097 [Irpex rosettiformis]
MLHLTRIQHYNIRASRKCISTCSLQISFGAWSGSQLWLSRFDTCSCVRHLHLFPCTAAMSTSATSNAFPTPALQDALATSVANGTFADTAYYLYSQRSRSWKIRKPRVVYANSGVMKDTTSYFLNHFNEDTAAGQRIESETENYGYESDSDIDDSEAEEKKSLESRWNELEDEDELDDDDDNTRVLSTPEHESPETMKKLELVGSQYKYRVVVPDMAANTWQALVHFVYTGTIHFAPLKSQGLELRQAEQTKHREKNPHLPPLCSPKSIYRLADSVGLDELKILARRDLEARISEENIIREVFSKFSSMYGDILDMELGTLYTSSMLPHTLPNILKTVTSIARGGMPYSEKALAALLTKLSTCVTPPKPVINTRPHALRHLRLARDPEPSDNKTECESLIVTPSVPPYPSNLFSPLPEESDTVSTSASWEYETLGSGFSAKMAKKLLVKKRITK